MTPAEFLNLPIGTKLINHEHKTVYTKVEPTTLRWVGKTTQQDFSTLPKKSPFVDVKSLKVSP